MYELTLEGGSLVLRGPYNKDLVTAIKGLPYSERRWDNECKLWIIDPAHGKQLQDWIKTFANEYVSVPGVVSSQMPVMKLLEVRYIGACKQRDDGQSIAFGMIGNNWSVIFPEKVLRTYFEGDFDLAEAPGATQTLYQILGIKRTATSDEIKSAYRRMAKQWHPDVCREPNARDVFIRIQDAYQLLSNDRARGRYDAGLLLEATLGREEQNNAVVTYRSPLRCGWIMVEGVEKVGRLEATKILEWQDIVKDGKTLVVSWPMGAQAPVEQWI